MVDILSTVIGRRYFTLFLEPLQASGLIGFYTSVEELKHSNKTAYHQLGAEIFYTYIRAPTSHIKIDKVRTTNQQAYAYIGTHITKIHFHGNADGSQQNGIIHVR